MFLNLGLTAHAAAAHQNELSALKPEHFSQPRSNQSSQSFSFGMLPSLALDVLCNNRPSYGARPPSSRKAHSRAMSEGDVDVDSSNEIEFSETASNIARRQTPRSRSTKRASPRPKTSYCLAHPPSHNRHRRLGIRPRLLLQLHQISQTPRPIPMLDVLPSTGYIPPLFARKFPAVFRGKSGLGPNDLIVVRSELFEQTVSSILDKHWEPDADGDDHREVVATICQILNDEARSKGKAEICLNHGPAWEAKPLPSGSYDFTANTPDGVRVVRWVLRSGRNRRSSGLSSQEDNKRFTFSVIDPSTRRHPVIASMTRNCIEVSDKYTKPSPMPSSAMSVVSDPSELDAPLGRDCIETDDDLRTLIVVTGIWVAFREGWSQNFSYDDSSAPKICSPHRDNPLAADGGEKDISVERKDHSRGGTPIEGKKHHSSSVLGNLSEIPRRRTYGGSSKRSNSTGANFMERVNRRNASTASGRPKRHSSVLAGSGASHRNADEDFGGRISTSSCNQRNTTSGSYSRLTKIDFVTSTGWRGSEEGPGIAIREEEAQQKQQPAPETLPQRDVKPPENGNVNQNTTQHKRRHRLSHLFDFFIRKGGHH